MKLHLSLAAVACFAAATLAQNQGQGQGQGQGGTTRPADTGKSDTSKSQSHALDGTWTVVAIEKNGQAMPDAKDMTVTIKDNTITCSGKDGKQSMTMKMDFTSPGQARVMMTDGSGTSGTGGTGGTTDRGTGTGGTGGADRGTGKSDDKGGSKQAVYVLTNDYLAVCIHDDQANSGGRGTGGTGSTDRGTGTGGQGGTGTITTGNSTQPSAKSFCSVILKRSGSGTGTGTGR